MSTEPTRVAFRLAAAINAHDIEALLACFADDVVSQHPTHPERNFHGKERVRQNWTSLFRTVPNIRAEVLCMAVTGAMVMVEWHWDGVQTDGAAWGRQGVTVMSIQDDLITQTRLYMDSVPA